MKCPAEKTSLAFQTFHSSRRVLQAVACSCSFSLLTGLISNLFNKKLTCLEGIHGPTFMDSVGKFQVCIYLKLYVNACETEMILACFVWLGVCLLVVRKSQGFDWEKAAPRPYGHVAPLSISCLWLP